ncbi:hypothetical protein K402DRAFT_424986 [Aulographum hederae CBS 113979]|uniref:Uncharacterized protein n=1 Tax=Aulographum hederae CBS 113979 TaxID=1176131 RepID=A0A6G1GLS7_9PEZI|nr:hypothetical protein K402DRAFT_424986 [Aulographum hederae CBS 113979]
MAQGLLKKSTKPAGGSGKKGNTNLAPRGSRVIKPKKAKLMAKNKLVKVRPSLAHLAPSSTSYLPPPTSHFPTRFLLSLPSSPQQSNIHPHTSSTPRLITMSPPQKHTSGLTALTERSLAEKAGHLEMLKGGKKDRNAEAAKKATKGQKKG